MSFNYYLDFVDPKKKSNILSLPTGEPVFEDDRSCRTLWLAVIYQALHDLAKDDMIAKDSARKWFFYANPSFPTVCNFAGLEMSIVRARAKDVQENPQLLGNFCV